MEDKADFAVRNVLNGFIEKMNLKNIIQRIKGKRCYKLWCFEYKWWCGEGFCTKHYYENKETFVIKKSWFRPSFETRNNPDKIKYAKDLIQPFKPDGTVNPAYVKAYKKDPRTDTAHRNNPRNINNRYAKDNFQVNEDFKKFEKKKYGI